MKATEKTVFEIVEPRNKFCKCGRLKDMLRRRSYSSYTEGKLYYSSRCSKCEAARQRKYALNKKNEL